jgi:hypothetical protein
MSYVIQRTDRENDLYVSPQGSLRSYTPLLQGARVFPTREAAEREKCDNERVLSLEEAMRS